MKHVAIKKHFIHQTNKKHYFSDALEDKIIEGDLEIVKRTNIFWFIYPVHWCRNAPASNCNYI